MRSRLIFSLFLLTLFVSPAFAQDSLHVRMLGRIAGGYGSSGLEVLGNYAYVGNGYSFQVIDISNPSSPNVVGLRHTPGYIRDVAVSGSYAYVADGDNGLRVINISNPSSPTVVGFYDTPGVALGVAVSGNYAYIADNDSGLRVIDVSNPTSPVEVSFCSTQTYAEDIALSGNFAYVLDGEYGIRVINVLNPHLPVEAGHCNTPCYSNGMAVSGNYAYVADCYYLRVIDLSNPSFPILVGSCYVTSYALGVAVSGNYAYVATLATISGDGFRVVNVSNPSSPTEAGYYTGLGSTHGIAVSGCVAYVTSSNYFDILDISYFSPCPVPRAPERLTISYLPQSGALRLRWAPVRSDTNGLPIEVTRYIVYRADSVNAAVWDSIGVPVPPDTTVFIDSTALQRGRSFYHVKAVIE